MRLPAPLSFPAAASRASLQRIQPVIVKDLIPLRCSTPEPPRSTAWVPPALSHSSAAGPPLSAAVAVHFAPASVAWAYIPPDTPVLAVDDPMFSLKASSTSSAGGSGPWEGPIGGFSRRDISSRKVAECFCHQ